MKNFPLAMELCCLALLSSMRSKLFMGHNRNDDDRYQESMYEVLYVWIGKHKRIVESVIHLDEQLCQSLLMKCTCRSNALCCLSTPSILVHCINSETSNIGNIQHAIGQNKLSYVWMKCFLYG
jgi:hypothetical protein